MEAAAADVAAGVAMVGVGVATVVVGVATVVVVVVAMVVVTTFVVVKATTARQTGPRSGTTDTARMSSLCWSAQECRPGNARQ